MSGIEWSFAKPLKSDFTKPLSSELFDKIAEKLQPVVKELNKRLEGKSSKYRIHFQPYDPASVRFSLSVKDKELEVAVISRSLSSVDAGVHSILASIAFEWADDHGDIIQEPEINLFTHNELEDVETSLREQGHQIVFRGLRRRDGSYGPRVVGGAVGIG